MNYVLWTVMAAFVVVAATAAYAQPGSPYAEDILREQAMQHASVSSPCPPRVMMHSLTESVMSESDANALLCHAVEELPLARDVREYGCTDRSELVIGMLLYWGVAPEALGRASTFYDATRNRGGTAVFVLEDAGHGEEFNRAWQLVFGNALRQEILLKTGEEDILLDVDGVIRWNIGHIAPTLWVWGKKGVPELRVLDPILSPGTVLTVAEWRRMQNAEPAAVLWGELGAPPDILTAYLSGPMRERLLREFTMPAHEELDTARLDALLRDMPPELKAAIYARILDIDAKAAWHPLQWSGYSLTGDKLPDWRAGDDALAQRRFDAAQQRLAPLLAYQEMRESFKDDEAFLNAVRERMQRQKDDPKGVFIDFTKEY